LRPGEEGRAEKFLQAMKKSLQKDSNWTFYLPYILALDNCMKCGTCAEVCPVYIESGRDPKYHPAARADQLRRIYLRYFTFLGRHFPWLVGATDLTEERLDALAESFYRCTICRRCAYVCPVAIDNGLIVREGRKILDAIGIAPEELRTKGTELQLVKGNAVGITTPAFKDIVEFMEEELEEEKGYKVPIPVDKTDADYLVIHNAGDYLSFSETVMGAAAVFNAAGVNWTLNSPDTGINDAVNYGVFYSDSQFEQVVRAQVETVKRLGAKTLVVGECGHAYEALKLLIRRLFPPEEVPFKVVSILEIMDKWIQNGTIKVDPTKNSGAITYHDSCKLGRLGGLYDEPRRILKAVTTDFREMNPNRELSYCCGGGSGFALMEKGDFLDFRMKYYGKVKVEQIEAIGAEVVALACSNCKGQFRDIINYYKLPLRYAGVSELVGNALVV